MIKELTRTYLFHNKFRLDWDKNGQPIIYRYGKLGNGQSVDWHKCTQTLITKHHPYGKDVQYYNITFNDKDNRHVTIPVSRFVMAWMCNVIPADFDVDHINGNTLDNRLENLQLLTRKENLAKRLSSPSETAIKWIALKKRQQEEQKALEEIYKDIPEKPYNEADFGVLYEINNKDEK